MRQDREIGRSFLVFTVALVEKNNQIAYNGESAKGKSENMKSVAMDTSNQSLSVALVEDGQLQAETLLTVKKNHSISLMPTLDFLMQSVGWSPKELDRIVVAHGPGSYTGLRVAVATAKTLAYALGSELVGVSSLLSLIPPGLSGKVIPLINARRNHVYAGVYDEGEVVLEDRYWALEDLLQQLETASPLTFVGEIADFQEQIQQFFPQALCMPSHPSAYQLALRSQSLPSQSVADFEPRYLKRVEAEENWLKDNLAVEESYIKRL